MAGCASAVTNLALNDITADRSSEAALIASRMALKVVR
jgi:hypothetical protein